MRGLLKLIAIGAGAVALATAGFALAGTVSVTLGPKGPQPGVVTVEWGDTLAFVNGDSVTHGLDSSRPELSTTGISPGATYAGAVTASAGSYRFRQTGGKSFPGTVVVAATGTVTLKASKTTVVYGQAVLLSGVASKPDTPVLIEQRVAGDTSWHPTGSVTSGADGSFTDPVRLQLSARLRASIAGGQIRSAAVAVTLRPVLTISATARATKAGRSIPVSARLSPPTAATHVTLFQCGPYTRGWRAVAARSPGAGGRVTFRWTAGYGRTLLRAVIERRYAAQGFETSQSGTIAVTASGSPPHGKSHPTQRC